MQTGLRQTTARDQNLLKVLRRAVSQGYQHRHFHSPADLAFLSRPSICRFRAPSLWLTALYAQVARPRTRQPAETEKRAKARMET